MYAPKTKRKGYSQNESPIIKTKAEQSFCYAPAGEKWVHFLYAFFQQKSVPGMAAKETC